MLWSLAKRHLEIDQRFGRTLSDTFHAPVFEVADEAAKGESVGMVKNVATEADALDTAGDQELYCGHEGVIGGQSFLFTIDTVA